MVKRAVIAGASGLVGSELLKILLAEPGYTEVCALVRKKLPVTHQKLHQVIADLGQPDTYAAAVNGHALFCCLGSTQKKTPNLDDYRKVDHIYPLKLARLALQNSMRQYHLVSALGADSSTSNFYTKMKGETEQDIAAVGLPSLHIYRPALLTGVRNEHRPLERVFGVLMKVINPLLNGRFRKYRSIAASTVASAMYKQSLTQQEGLHIYPSDKIKELA